MSEHNPDPSDDEPIIPDGPDADLVEQSQVVEERQSFEPTGRRDDVPEADWLEQSVTEPIDDEER